MAGGGGGGTGMAVMGWDAVLSFMWVWSGVLIKIFIFKFLGLTYKTPQADVVYFAIAIFNMFFFAIMGKVTNGGAYNPLTVLSSAVVGGFPTFVFTVGARIPAQVFGSIVGVRLILDTFPEIGRGPELKVDIHRGALTEGLLTFSIVIISLALSRNIPGSFYRKNWISSISKLTLHILGSDLTGGCMNPAAVMGWAYARGDHITKEHIFVYWLAPIGGTLLAVWVFGLLFQPAKKEEKEQTNAKKTD